MNIIMMIQLLCIYKLYKAKMYYIGNITCYI